MSSNNPFTERGRITDPSRFVGRWSELSLLFEQIEAGRPVLVSGPPGIGKSSLLTHVMQSAATNLEEDGMRAYYLDLSQTDDAANVYQAVIQALGQRGNNQAALEVALLAVPAPVLVCLDNAHTAVAQGWGVRLIEELARTARGHQLLMVAAFEGALPRLSERFGGLSLGAFAPTEVRLLVESYLDDTGVVFAPSELRALAEVSVAHPAYLQRAAYHLFESKLRPDYDWRAAYFVEATERPVPGAPLPPEAFKGGTSVAEQSTYNADSSPEYEARPDAFPLPEIDRAWAFVLPPLLGALLIATIGSLPLALVVTVVGLALVALLVRRTTSRKT